MTHFYDRDGNEMSIENADRELSAFGKRVARTAVGGVDVSTVWLGVDYNHGGVGDRLLFETMLFCDGNRNNAMTRYCTEEQALRGHLEAIDALRAGRELGWWTR